ncbi:MAG: hypothetical protein ACYCOU_01660 [Sulfobacillus sp.]
MDPALAVLLNKLKTLSKLDEHDKLRFEGDDIFIQTDGISTKISRWWHNQNKEQTMLELNNLLSQIGKYVQDLLNSPDRLNFNSLDATHYDTEQLDQVTAKLNRITRSMQEAEQGLHKLKVTYAEVPLAIAKLETLLEDFRLLHKSVIKKLETVSKGNDKPASQPQSQPQSQPMQIPNSGSIPFFLRDQPKAADTRSAAK